ncbi:MAG: hypothetical protein Q8O38_10105 [Sulfurimicrobium sp.]|nr:hypothetical protein [Sulfurimicrobium sp.]
MKDTVILSEIMHDVVSNRLSTAVLAGHYCLSENMSELSHEEESEQASFDYGASIVGAAREYGLQSSLILWVNDIGVNPDKRMMLKESYQIPHNYQRILEKWGLNPASVDVMFESTMRNKASVLLRKLYARSPHLFRKVSSTSEGLVRCVSNSSCSIEPEVKDAYVITGPNMEDLVVKEGPNPKCNLILASLFDSIRKDKNPDRIINIFNHIYTYRISLGIHVATTLIGCRIEMNSLFCEGAEITAHEETRFSPPISLQMGDYHSEYMANE